MPEIQLDLDGDGAWKDLAGKGPGQVIQLDDATPLRMAVLEHSMASGVASVAFRFDLPDGRVVLAQTSLRALWSTVAAVASRSGEPHMQVQPTNDTIKQLQLAIGAITKQLFQVQVKLGITPHVDLREADAAWAARWAEKETAARAERYAEEPRGE